MNNPTIADSAIYQYTVQLAEKYKAQRDELLSALKTTAGNIGSIKASCQCKTYDTWLDMVETAIAKVEKSS